MSEEAKKARREWQRNWHRNHPGKAKEYNERYWEKKAKEAAEKEGNEND